MIMGIVIAVQDARPDEGRTDPGKQEVVVSEQVTLDAKFEIAGPALKITYEVTNKGEFDLYLLNRIPKTLPQWSLSPDTIYIDLETKRKGVLFSKEIAPLPEGVMVNSPVSPLVTPVRAGTKFTESVQVKLPVAEYRQYNTGRKNEVTQEVDYSKVRLILQYYWGAAGVTETVRKIQDDEVVMPQFPPGVMPKFARLDTGPVDLVIPVLEPVADDVEEQP